MIVPRDEIVGIQPQNRVAWFPHKYHLRVDSQCTVVGLI